MSENKKHSPQEAANAVLAKVTEMLKKTEESKSNFLSKPYVSDSQRRWAHTEAGKEALGGEKVVEHWDKESKGKDLPEKVEKAEDSKPIKTCTCGEHLTTANTKYQGRQKTPESFSYDLDLHNCKKCGTTVTTRVPKDSKKPTEVSKSEKENENKLEKSKPKTEKENEIGTKFEKDEKFPKGEIHPKEHVEGEPVDVKDRIKEQKSPESNPKEQKEGNNNEWGSVPGVKGHIKLAKFIGHIQAKRQMKAGQK